MKKKSFLILFICILMLSTNVFASEVTLENELIQKEVYESILNEDIITPFGTSIPKNSIDLSKNDYNGYIESMAYSLYTDVAFRNVDSISFRLTGIPRDYIQGSLTKRVSVGIYQIGKSGEIERKYTESNTSLSGTFYNLDPSKEYYLRVYKTNDKVYIDDLDLEVWH